MPENNRSQIVAGSVLITVGLMLFALQYVEGALEALVFFVAGGALVGLYISRKMYGLLIPGCILLGWGLSQLGRYSFWSFGDPDEIGLGLGFLLIFVIDLIVKGSTHWWPLIPGFFLIVTGLEPDNALVRWVLHRGWPLILVLIGIGVLVAGMASQRSDTSEAGKAPPSAPPGSPS